MPTETAVNQKVECPVMIPITGFITEFVGGQPVMELPIGESTHQQVYEYDTNGILALTYENE